MLPSHTHTHFFPPASVCVLFKSWKRAASVKRHWYRFKGLWPTVCTELNSAEDTWFLKKNRKQIVWVQYRAQSGVKSHHLLLPPWTEVVRYAERTQTNGIHFMFFYLSSAMSLAANVQRGAKVRGKGGRSVSLSCINKQASPSLSSASCPLQLQLQVLVISIFTPGVFGPLILWERSFDLMGIGKSYETKVLILQGKGSKYYKWKTPHEVKNCHFKKKLSILQGQRRKKLLFKKAKKYISAL